MKTLFLIALIEYKDLASNKESNSNKKVSLYKYIENIKKLNDETDFRNLIKEIFQEIEEKKFKASMENASKILTEANKNKIEIIPFFSDKYPEQLIKRDMNKYPLILYAKGDSSLLKQGYRVAIVGTREPIEESFVIGSKITEIFIERGFIIVSGLAKGCDTIAHSTAVKKNGKTIAVLAHSVTYIYPKENESLAENIVDSGGLLVSEYPPIYKKIKKFNFVERDRIQSGISHAVCVIQTGVKGGTMHTVEYAKKQKVPICCVNFTEEIYNKYEKTLGNKKIIEEGGHPISTEKIEEDVSQFIDKLLSVGNNSETKNQNIKSDNKTRPEANLDLSELQYSIPFQNNEK